MQDKNGETYSNNGNCASFLRGSVQRTIRKDISVAELRLQAELNASREWGDFKYKGDVWADGMTEQAEYDTREMWFFSRPAEFLDIKIGRQILRSCQGPLPARYNAGTDEACNEPEPETLVVRILFSYRQRRLRPNIHYRYTDRTAFELGANVFPGRHPSTFFGQYENDTNIYTAIRYSF